MNRVTKPGSDNKVHPSDLETNQGKKKLRLNRAVVRELAVKTGIRTGGEPTEDVSNSR